MDKTEFRTAVIEYQCGQKCMGHAGNRGGCCTMDERDFIIGPIRDSHEFLSRLSQHLGRPVERNEVLIDFDEGMRLFPDLSCWTNPASFPALRVQTDHPRKPCRFYDVGAGRCTIHPVRPETCRLYECGWLKEALERVC